jgi:hypothetical protein
MKKAVSFTQENGPGTIYGRCERIRTFDPLHPMQVRYQAAPHTDQACDYRSKTVLKLRW